MNKDSDYIGLGLFLILIITLLTCGYTLDNITMCSKAYNRSHNSTDSSTVLRLTGCRNG